MKINDIKGFELTYTSAKPLQIVDHDKPFQLTKRQEEIISVVGKTIQAYSKEINNLLRKAYSNLEEFIPPHLKNNASITVVCCKDGIVIRYEKDRKSEIIVGWSHTELVSIVPALSEMFIFCHKDKNSISTIPKSGTEIILERRDISGESSTLSRFRVGMDLVLEKNSMDSKSQKPESILSIDNSFELNLHGKFITEKKIPRNRKQFIVKSIITLPVAWQHIEIYPFYDLRQWNTKVARSWAETDILKSVVAKQTRENYLSTLDPTATARKEFVKLLSEFRTLLDLNSREESLQKFLEKNPSILIPTRIKVWPKLKLVSSQSKIVG